MARPPASISNGSAVSPRRQLYQSSMVVSRVGAFSAKRAVPVNPQACVFQFSNTVITRPVGTGCGSSWNCGPGRGCAVSSGGWIAVPDAGPATPPIRADQVIPGEYHEAVPVIVRPSGLITP